MKKFTTQITKNNKTKCIFVIVDNKTAKILEKSDEKVRHEYIVGEHQIYLNELKETRRHQSMDAVLESGHEFEDEELSIEEKYIEKENYEALHKAISSLSKEQQWLVNEVFYKGKTIVDIAKTQGVSHVAILHRLEKIYEKIKKFCI